MSALKPQLERQDDGSLYVCIGARREVWLPAGAAAYLETILARFEEKDRRGPRLFLTGVIVGVVLATGHFPARKDGGE